MNQESRSIMDSAVCEAAKVDIEKIVRTKLPPLPGSVLKISELLRDVNVSTRALANAVGFDPMLAARVLRLANSPIFFMQKEVTSLFQAIDVIGTKSLNDIVMMGIAADSFAAEIRGSVLGRLIWEHSLAVALVAKELIKACRIRGADEVFICGLLHDIGKIMLLRADHNAYSNALDKHEETEMIEWERESFGYDHTLVGTMVARRWQLPEAVCEAIMDHHESTAANAISETTHIIAAADIIANYNGYGLRLETEAALTESASMLFLALKPEQTESIWQNVQPAVEEAIQTFR